MCLFSLPDPDSDPDSDPDFDPDFDPDGVRAEILSPY